MKSSLVSTIVVILIAVVIGVPCQFVFWSSDGRQWFIVLIYAPFMWFIYVVISALIVEHTCRFLNKKIPYKG